MKKIKLLTGLVGLTGLSMGLIPTIASCGCSTTGLQVEMVSKKKEREFNQRTNSVIYTFKVEGVSTTTKLKVKLVNLLVDGAETQSVAGLLKTTYDSAGNVRVFIDTTVLASQWPNATNFTFDLEFTNKEAGKTTTLTGFSINFTSLLTAPSFETVEWSEIFTKLDEYYETGSLDDFVKSFGDEDGFAFADIKQYVGLERSITINDQTHIIKVIGVNHDKLTTPINSIDQALFTFQLFTLLSDSNGNLMRCKWDSDGMNYDYTNSTLRKNLTGQGDGTLKWYNSDKTESTNTKTVLKMIEDQNSELYSKIKKVTKTTATNPTEQEGEENYELTTYNDVLFPLSAIEITNYQWTIQGQGKIYHYWSLNEQKSSESEINIGRAFNDINENTRTEYWLSSPMIMLGRYSTLITCKSYTGSMSGEYGAHYAESIYGVNFAFCI